MLLSFSRLFLLYSSSPLLSVVLNVGVAVSSWQDGGIHLNLFLFEVCATEQLAYTLILVVVQGQVQLPFWISNVCVCVCVCECVCISIGIALTG